MAGSTKWMLQLRRWVVRVAAALLIVAGPLFTTDVYEAGFVSPQFFGGLLAYLVAVVLLGSRWIRRAPEEKPAHRMDVALLALASLGWLGISIWLGSIDANYTGDAVTGQHCGTIFSPSGSALLGCDDALKAQFFNVLFALQLTAICLFLFVRLLMRVNRSRRASEHAANHAMFDGPPPPPPSPGSAISGIVPPLSVVAPAVERVPRAFLRRGRTWVGVAAAALLVGLVVTALNPPKPSAEDREFDRLSHTALPASEQPPDPCALLTAVDIQESLDGVTLDPRGNHSSASLAKAITGDRSCFWEGAEGADGLLSLTVMTERSMRASVAAKNEASGRIGGYVLPLRGMVMAPEAAKVPGGVVRKGSITWQYVPGLGRVTVLTVNTNDAEGGQFVSVDSEDGVAYFRLDEVGFSPKLQRASTLALAKLVSARLAAAEH